MIEPQSEALELSSNLSLEFYQFAMSLTLTIQIPQCSLVLLQCDTRTKINIGFV